MPERHLLTKTLWCDPCPANSKGNDDFIWPGVNKDAYGIDEGSGGGSGGWKKGRWNAGFGGKDWKSGGEMMRWKKKRMAIGNGKFIRFGVRCVRKKHGWAATPVPMRLGNNGCFFVYFVYIFFYGD